MVMGSQHVASMDMMKRLLRRRKPRAKSLGRMAVRLQEGGQSLTNGQGLMGDPSFRAKDGGHALGAGAGVMTGRGPAAKPEAGGAEDEQPALAGHWFVGQKNLELLALSGNLDRALGYS